MCILFHPWRRRRRPQQRAVPRQRFWARQSQISERQGATPVGGPHPIRHGTQAVAGPPRRLSLSWDEIRLWNLRVPLGDTGQASGFPVARGLLNSAEETRDSYSPRWVRAQKEIVSDRLCGVVPAFCALRVSGSPAWLETRPGQVGGRGRNAHGHWRGSVNTEGSGASVRTEPAQCTREWGTREHACAQRSRVGRSVHWRGPRSSRSQAGGELERTWVCALGGVRHAHLRAWGRADLVWC